MQISEVRLKKREGDSRFLASGSITFEGQFVVSGIKVMRSNEGHLFVAYLIITRDFAGNQTKKKLTSQRTLLTMFRTSIDRGAY